MDSFEINKIVASILLIALLFIGIGKISDLVFKVDKPDTPGYKVEIPENGLAKIAACWSFGPLCNSGPQNRSSTVNLLVPVRREFASFSLLEFHRSIAAKK